MAVGAGSGASKIEHSDSTIFQEVESNANSLDDQVGNWGNTSYDKNFFGFDANHRGDFNTACDAYIRSVNDILAGFDSKKQTIEGSIKGDVADALDRFFDRIKNLCMNYTKALEEEKAKVYEAEQNWLRASQGVAAAVDADTDTITNPVFVAS